MQAHRYFRVAYRQEGASLGRSRMLEKIQEGYDIVIGSRFASKKRPINARMLGSRLISLAIFLTTRKKIKDPTSGMRMYDRKCMKEFAQEVNYGPEPDTVSYLLKNGAKIDEVQVEMDMVCLRYQFELEDYEGNVFYYANHEFYHEPRTHIDYMYDCPQDLREEEMVETPDWAKNKVVYQIFPSRFATSKDVSQEEWYQAPIDHKADLKGDLRGIINHLDHIKNWVLILFI